MLSPTILVIDDVSDLVDEMVAMFGLCDLVAVGASSIGDGLDALLAWETIGVIICDLHLRQEHGYDLLTRIADIHQLACRSFGFIFISGAEQIQTMHADHVVLSKPVHPRMLVQEVRTMLRGTS